MLVTGDYAAQGPHFLDWKSLHEKGCVSMVAIPMFSCNVPVGVLCLASSKHDAFANTDRVRMLAGVLAPYIALLEYTTRRMEMQRLVNDIITPIAAQLAQQKHSQLARVGCTVEETANHGAAGAAGGGKPGEPGAGKQQHLDTQQYHSVAKSHHMQSVRCLQCKLSAKGRSVSECTAS